MNMTTYMKKNVLLPVFLAIILSATLLVARIESELILFGFLLLLFLLVMYPILWMHIKILKKWKLEDETRQVSVKVGTNENNLAKEIFSDLLNAAEKKLEIFDDGNKMEGSIYECKAVARQVKEKLENNPEFQVLCFFNSKDKTYFKEEFDDNDQVTIRYTEEERGPEEHYKIVDDGRMVYVSQHELNESERNFRLYDLRDVEPEYFCDIVTLLFGEIRDKTHEKFNHESVSKK